MKRIGIKALDPFETSSLKSDLLWFDEILIDPFSIDRIQLYCASIDNTFGEKKFIPSIQNWLADLQYLTEKNVVKGANLMHSAGVIRPAIIKNLNPSEKQKFESKWGQAKVRKSSLLKKIEDNIDFFKNAIPDRKEQLPHRVMELLDHMMSYQELSVIEAASFIGYTDSKNEYTALVSSENPYELNHDDKTDVLKLILKTFPVPTLDVSFERILDFKNDEDSIKKILAIRSWTSKVTSSNRSAIDIYDELQYLINEYESQLKLHEMKYQKSVAELIIVTSLEIIENLVTLNFSKAAKTIFDMKNKKLNFLLDESRLIGKEVAYITKIRKFVKNGV